MDPADVEVLTKFAHFHCLHKGGYQSANGFRHGIECVISSGEEIHDWPERKERTKKERITMKRKKNFLRKKEIYFGTERKGNDWIAIIESVLCARCYMAYREEDCDS